MTDAEQKLWWHLRQHQIDGARFRRQVPVGDCVLDFVCLDKRVVVEVDGGQHADRQAHDAARSAWLEAQGFQVLRFWNNEVMGNLEGVLTVVQQALRSRESTSRALNERRASPPPRPEARPNMAEPLRRHEAALREPPPTPPVKGEGANPAPPPTKAARIPPSPLTGEGRGGGGRMTPAGTASAGPLTGEVWDGGDSQRSNPTSVHLTPVRLGLNRIVGLSQDSAERIVAARRERGFAGTEDLTRRAQLDAGDLQRLAQADALVQLTGHRHAAAWSVAGIDTRPTAMLAAMPSRERPIHNALADDRDANDDDDAKHGERGNADAQPLLRPPSEAEDMLADYAALGLSLKAHPLALLRETLNPFKVQTAAVLRGYPSGRLARASGLVTHRQRPETAKGTVFVTLEDDTGAVNVIVWPNVAEAQRKPLLAATLLTVYGVWQKEGEVMHLLAHKLVDHTPLLRGLVARSRNFR